MFMQVPSAHRIEHQRLHRRRGVIDPQSAFGEVSSAFQFRGIGVEQLEDCVSGVDPISGPGRDQNAGRVIDRRSHSLASGTERRRRSSNQSGVERCDVPGSCCAHRRAMRRARKPPWVVGDPRVAALTLDHRFQLLERRTRVESPPHHQLRIGVGPETAGHQHPRREPDDQIGELGGARTAQDLDTFLDFEGVADGAPERRVHAADERLRSDTERAPVATIDRASARALSRSFMKAPRPHFTSSTSAVLPSASFLLMIDAAMSGTLSTVAVTSRKRVQLLVRRRERRRLHR